MKRTLALVLTVVIAMPVVSLAQPSEGAILQSAERAAAGLELQSEASGNRRSRGRTWAGLVMIATGRRPPSTGLDGGRPPQSGASSALVGSADLVVLGVMCRPSSRRVATTRSRFGRSGGSGAPDMLGK